MRKYYRFRESSMDDLKDEIKGLLLEDNVIPNTVFMGIDSTLYEEANFNYFVNTYDFVDFGYTGNLGYNGDRDEQNAWVNLDTIDYEDDAEKFLKDLKACIDTGIANEKSYKEVIEVHAKEDLEDAIGDWEAEKFIDTFGMDELLKHVKIVDNEYTVISASEERAIQKMLDKVLNSYYID